MQLFTFSIPFVTELLDFQPDIIQYKVTQYISEKQQHKNVFFFHVKKSKLWLIFNKPSIYESDDKQLEISKLLHFNSLSAWLQRIFKGIKPST